MNLVFNRASFDEFRLLSEVRVVTYHTVTAIENPDELPRRQPILASYMQI